MIRSQPRALGNTICVAVAIVLGGFAGCGEDEPAVPLTPPPTTIPRDELVTVKRGTIAAGPLIAGTLEASRRATIVAELGGTVREIGPELGDRVREGQLLARIDPTALGQAEQSARAQVASAEAELQVARRELERSRALVEAGAIPRRDVEVAQSQLAAKEAALANARAQLANASEQLGNATVTSPLDGVVARRAVSTGDVVTPGAVLYELIDPSSMRLSGAVPSDALAAVQRGTRVRFTVRGYPDEQFIGTINYVAPSVDPQTRQIPILVEIPNPSERLLAGLFAQGRVASEKEQGLIVPTSAIEAEGPTPSVRRVRGGVVESVPVEVGLRDPMTDRVLVTEGLEEGDQIVERVATAPPPGTPVTTAPAG